METLIINQGNKLLNQTIEKPSQTLKPLELEEKTTLPFAYRNGIFYLIAFEGVVFSLAIIANKLPIYSLIVVVVATILFFILINVFQLMMDKQITEKSFIELVEIVVKQLPVFGSILKNIQDIFKK